MLYNGSPGVQLLSPIASNNRLCLGNITLPGQVYICVRFAL